MAADGLVAAPSIDGIIRVLNCLPSSDTEQDWRLQNAVSAGLVSAAATLPPARDLRRPWWTVADQGSTGSCVGWALADSVLRWQWVEAGRLMPGEELSPRFAWMAAKETDEFSTEPSTFVERAGTSLKAALDIARHYGAVRDSVLPFGSGELFDGEVNTFYAIAATFKIVAYVNLGRDNDAWRQWLAGTGPVLVRLGVDRTWDRASGSGGDLDRYEPSTARGGHAVALAGYTPDRFVVRNSWGSGWGDAGYGYASAAYAQAAFTEAYGVTVLAGAPPGPASPRPWRP